MRKLIKTKLVGLIGSIIGLVLSIVGYGISGHLLESAKGAVITSTYGSSGRIGGIFFLLLFNLKMVNVHDALLILMHR